jgi:hypothetical protein
LVDSEKGSFYFKAPFFCAGDVISAGILAILINVPIIFFFKNS